MSEDWAAWASRRGAGADRELEAAVPVPPAAPPTAVAPAPPGYAWAMHPEAGMILVPIQRAPSTIVPPPRQPNGAVPFANRVTPFAAGKPESTCVLVKSDGKDPWADVLATIPEIAPPSGYDAMNGNPDPEVQRELAGFSEFHDKGFAVHPEAPLQAYPRAGMGAPSTASTSTKLGR